MVIEQIEKVKQQYTDKYVQVDGNRAELARFKDLVGQVKTVNMSGRALVEFMDYHLNIGWFDIDLDYLKVVDKPAPKPKEEKKPAAKKKPVAKSQAAGGEKKLSPLEMARQGDGGAKKKPAAKKSTADVLAALRGGGKPAAAKSKPTVPKPEVAATPEATPEVAAAPAAASGPVDKSGMSIDEMVAYCREKDA